MARTDYGAILSTVIKDTSDAIREVNDTSALIAPNNWGTQIRTMHSDADYENALSYIPTKTVSGAIASFNDGAGGLNLKSLKVAINATQSGSGTPAPDNIRPIIGVSECNVVRCGVNLWDEEWEVGEYRTTNGTKFGNTGVRCKNLISVVPNSQIYFYCETKTSGNSFGYVFYDIDKVYIEGSATSQVNLTVPANAYYMAFFVPNSWYGSVYNNDISVNYPAADTTYHAYTGNTYTIQLGDTYYGGSLDVTNGLLTITRQLVTLNGSETYIVASQTYIKSDACDAFIIDARIYPIRFYGGQPDDLISDKLKFVKQAIWYTVGYSNCFAINNNQIHINVANDLLGITDYTQETTSTVKTKIANWVTNNPITVIIPISPITVQLTPTQVEQLLGANNVWADTGDVEELIFTDRQVYYGR